MMMMMMMGGGGGYILCYRCVYAAEQLTNERVHGVINRGDVSEISTYIQNAIDKDFSGNIIDCVQ